MEKTTYLYKINAATIPFFGTLKMEYDLFQYFLKDIQEDGVKITIPKALTYQCNLNEIDFVNLHLPIQTQLGIANWGRLESLYKKIKECLTNSFS